MPRIFSFPRLLGQKSTRVGDLTAFREDDRANDTWGTGEWRASGPLPFRQNCIAGFKAIEKGEGVSFKPLPNLPNNRVVQSNIPPDIRLLWP
jgi:hypothetical protein